MEDITDADYAHVKSVCKDFEIKFWRISWFVYSMWYFLVSWCIWERSKLCLKIYGLDPAKFVSASGLVWYAVLKTTKETLDLLTGINMLLMVEKGIRG